MERKLNEKDLVKKRVGKHFMYLDRTDKGISKTLIQSSNKKKWVREPEFMQIIEDEIKPGMTVVDIGGNIGYVSLVMASLVGDEGKVYSIEPAPRNFEILKRNIALNNYSKRVNLYNSAISNKKGTVDFFISSKSNLHALFSHANTNDSIRVEVMKLDELFCGKPQPNFIKMDIEGAEVEALEGMMDMLSTTEQPVKILMEVHPRFYSEDHSLERQLKKLIEIGFNTKYVTSAATERPQFFRERGYEPFAVYDDGLWRRGVYNDITNEDMLAASCHKHLQNVKLSARYLLRRPWHILSRNQVSDKIVRSIMIEKD